MRRVQGCLAIVVLLTATPLFAQSKAKVTNVPEIPYDSVANALKLPDNLYIGEGIGVATNSKGHVYVYTRSGATRLFEFDQNGTFVKEIGWDPQGNIYISDGYTNSRVVKYDKNGKFVKSVGSRGAAPGQMNTPHSLQVDAKGNVYVADRGNARIQVFDSNLVLRAIYDHVGNPWTLCITPGPHQYLYSSNSYPDSNPANARDITGEVYKMELDGTVVGKFGKAGKQLKEFSTIHGMDCRNENELWVSEITAWRVQKIVLHTKAAAKPTYTTAR